MVEITPPKLVEPATSPQRYVPPSGMQLRAQSVYRLQIGLLGLAAMLLLVGLANVMLDRAKAVDEGIDPIEEVIAVDEEPKKQAADALADIGVVPAAEPEPEKKGGVPKANDAEAMLIN